LLIEWEDTFPYVRDLAVLGSNGPSCPAGAYTAEEARELLKLAGDAGLAVVPLVQTIGHLEVILVTRPNSIFRNFQHIIYHL
jgi:hexosaminidase